VQSQKTKVKTLIKLQSVTKPYFKDEKHGKARKHSEKKVFSQRTALLSLNNSKFCLQNGIFSQAKIHIFANFRLWFCKIYWIWLLVEIVRLVSNSPPQARKIVQLRHFYVIVIQKTANMTSVRKNILRKTLKIEFYSTLRQQNCNTSKNILPLLPPKRNFFIHFLLRNSLKIHGFPKTLKKKQIPTELAIKRI
jgi:hypothetical protein